MNKATGKDGEKAKDPISGLFAALSLVLRLAVILVLGLLIVL